MCSKRGVISLNETANKSLKVQLVVLVCQFRQFGRDKCNIGQSEAELSKPVLITFLLTRTYACLVIILISRCSLLAENFPLHHFARSVCFYRLVNFRCSVSKALSLSLCHFHPRLRLPFMCLQVPYFVHSFDHKPPSMLIFMLSRASTPSWAAASCVDFYVGVGVLSCVLSCSSLLVCASFIGELGELLWCRSMST